MNSRSSSSQVCSTRAESKESGPPRVREAAQLAKRYGVEPIQLPRPVTRS